MASTEVMTKWPAVEVHQAQLAVRHNRPVPKVQISSTKKPASDTVSQPDRISPSCKRASLFTRRRSLSQTSNQQQRESSEQVNNSQSPVSARSQSVNETMVGMDVDQLKSKLLSGLQSSKKAAPRNSISGSTESPSRTNQARPSPIKATHEQARSSRAPQASPRISKPFGFQHLAKIEKSPRPELTIVDIAQASIAAFNFQACSHDQKLKPQKRPPPLRPKRPEEHEIPRDLLSPRVGLPMLRQAKSAEVVGSPIASPTYAPQQSLPPHTPRLVSHQRSYSLSYVGAGSPCEPKSAGFELQSSPLSPRSKHDESASTERSGMPNTNALLEQVAEESEGTITPRPPRSFSRIQSSRPLDASAPPPSLSQFDDLEPFLPRISLLPSIMLPRPLSCGSDTLGDLSLRPFEIDMNADHQQEVSEVVDEFDFTSSWDDDIEFAYSHGAEAHCDFDWLNLPSYANAIGCCESSESVVLQEVPINRGTRHEQSSSWASTAGSDYGPVHRSRLGRTSVPQRDSVPDLEDHVLSHSGSSSSLIVGTPEDQFGFMGAEPGIAASPDCERRPSDAFDFISPVLPPLGLKYELDTDQLFDDLMAGFTMKQRHNSMLPTLEPKTYHDPRQRHRSISSPLHMSQPPTSHPNADSPRASKRHDFRSSDASVFTTMKVCLDTALTVQRPTQVPATAPTSSPTSSKARKSRSKTMQSEWPIVITRHSLDAPTSTTSSPRSSSDSETREVKMGTSPSKSTSIGPKTKTRRSSISMHKKAASADGLPLSRHAFLTRSSTPARNLFASQVQPANKEVAIPATRARRMTAL